MKFLLLVVATSRRVFALQVAPKDEIHSPQVDKSTSLVDSFKSDDAMLYMMEDKGLNSYGAVCLDGSDAGFYFTKAAGETSTRSWQIIFEGGGWCTDKEECGARSDTPLGSSKEWTKSYEHRPIEGFLDRNLEKNPTFGQFNQVIVPYCDGTSFTGNLKEPVRSKNGYGLPVHLYFRGKRILDAVFDTLLEKFGMHEAEEILITGYSAGGLATLLYADYIHERMKLEAPNLVRFGAVPLSAFFLDHYLQIGKGGNGLFLQDSRTFSVKLLNMTEFANSSGSLPKRCVEALGKNSSECIFSKNAYHYSKAPVFVVNSGVDLFQISLVLAEMMPLRFADEKESEDVMTDDTESGEETVASVVDDPSVDEKIFAKSQCVSDDDCSADQMRLLWNFQNLLEETIVKEKPDSGSGIFLHSCPLHTEALAPAWQAIDVKGVTMQKAVLEWWLSDGKDATEKHTTLDCHWNKQAPYACNPTCAKVHQGVE